MMPGANFVWQQVYTQRANPAAAAEEMKRFEDIKNQRDDAQRNLEKALRMVAEPRVDTLDEDQP